MKILNLVLYSNSPDYNQFKKYTEEYYRQFDNVKTIYYIYSNKMIEDYKMMDNILYINGRESYIPGILKKTIAAFSYNYDYDYDYLVRTNISTIVDFDILIAYLKKNYIDYGCAEKMIYTCNDEIINYASGTFIIFSKNIIKNILSNNHLINYDYIDDVALGLFMKENYPEIILIKIMHLISVNNFTTKINDNLVFTEQNLIDFNDFCKSTNTSIAFRNHNGDREIDIIQLKKLVEYKLNKV